MFMDIAARQETCAYNLSKLRGEIQKTRKEVAQYLGLSLTAYSAYEKETFPTTKNLIRLADWYGVTPNNILGYDNDDTGMLDFKTAVLYWIKREFYIQAEANGGIILARECDKDIISMGVYDPDAERFIIPEYVDMKRFNSRRTFIEYTRNVKEIEEVKAEFEKST